ncbi:MAG: glycerophosphodiester phosphodiesterase [Dehalococcoidia bacterium]
MEPIGNALAPVVDGKRRVVCCHSGTLSGRFPPNSLAAVEECVAERVPRLEVDVRFMADDSMLIFHDATLDRATTVAGAVGSLSRANVAHARYLADESHGLCFLEDVVDLLRGSSTTLQVDLKLMRPITQARASALLRALKPLRQQVIIGSQAHWNLRSLGGVPLAFDPTLQWHYDPERRMEEALPRQMGVHGLWDDSPLAAIPHASANSYVEQRIQDLLNLFPQAVEWMVDIRTIEHIHSLGTNLAERLARASCALAAWTIRQHTPNRKVLVRELCALGVETFISDVPVAVANDLAVGPS